MVYYGVYLSTPNVGGNLYMNFFLTSFIEVFCLPIIVWSSDRWVQPITKYKQGNLESSTELIA